MPNRPAEGTHYLPPQLTIKPWPACRPADRRDNGTTALSARERGPEAASAVQPSHQLHASFGHLPSTLPCKVPARGEGPLAARLYSQFIRPVGPVYSR